MAAEGITIKGMREGLVITLSPACETWPDALLQLEARLAATPTFFKGARVGLVIGPYELTENDIRAARDLLLRHDLTLWAVVTDNVFARESAARLGLDTRLGPPWRPGELVEASFVPASASDGALTGGSAPVVAGAPAMASATEEDYTDKALVLRRTLRSGMRVHHPGSVMILGDVHPGAEVVAGGDVMVWGKLHGLVHAGAFGNDAAVVCALDLSPTQLRINRYFTRSPDDRRHKAQPETGQVRGGRIEVVAWSPKNSSR
jgi:septum site-determining protein MinC